MSLDKILTLVVYLIISFFLFYIGKIAYRLFHPRFDINSELVEKDNLAFALSYTGYFIGLVIIIGGSIIGRSEGLIEDLTDILIYGILSIILLNFSIFVNDRFILRKFSVTKEIIDDQNAGTGVVEAAICISSGLIIFSAVSGEGGSIFTAVGYWIIGLVVMVIVSFIYNLMTPYDIHEHIEQDNVAVGIGFAGALVAIGNIIRAALMGDFFNWTDTLNDIWLPLIIGLMFLPIVRLLADKVLLPGRKLTDEIINQEKPNHGAAIIEAFAYIGSSMFITWSL
ncbi:MAG: DUF350 domain-containing protein [Candidatus Marinimicrobia bacterium]|nr:DUF350 domain-containing protein [Candidatus Neomarinimicrobiota bacterium]